MQHIFGELEQTILTFITLMENVHDTKPPFVSRVVFYSSFVTM